MPRFFYGQRVHVNKDDPQWGRIAGDGTVVDVQHRTLMVSVDSVRAYVLVQKKNVTPLWTNR